MFFTPRSNKSITRLAFYALILGLCACKKSSTEEPQREPQCPIKQSLVTSVEIEKVPGYPVTEVYTYDSLHRLASVINWDNISTITFLHRSSDSVEIHIPNQGLIGLRTYDKAGNHLYSRNINLTNSGDTASDFIFIYSYNASGERTSRKSFQIGHSTGGLTIGGLLDSIQYTWKDNNLVTAVGNTYNGSYGPVSYSYLPNTNGSFIYNMPEAIPSFDYYATSNRPKLSHELVSSIKYPSGESTFEYTFDASGRVARFILSCTGTSPDQPRAGKYTFHYQCR
jgi:hypothetical protein